MVLEHNHESQGGHETRDINLKGVAIFIVALVLTLIGTHLVVIETLRFYIRHQSTAAPATLIKALPVEQVGPGLLVNAPVQLREMREREDQMLDSSGWVDRNLGVVRIPIARAMDLVIQRGLPKKIGESPQLASGERAQ
jgi:hypothetical protein